MHTNSSTSSTSKPSAVIRDQQNTHSNRLSTVPSKLFDKPQNSKSIRPPTISQSSLKSTASPRKLAAAVYSHSNCLSKAINLRPSVNVNYKLNGVDVYEYLKVEKYFIEQWTKLTAHYPVPPIPLAVYAIYNEALTNRYHQYKKKTFSHPSESNKEWYFHGTSIS